MKAMYPRLLHRFFGFIIYMRDVQVVENQELPIKLRYYLQRLIQRDITNFPVFFLLLSALFLLAVIVN